jgi:hypothetical protein
LTVEDLERFVEGFPIGLPDGISGARERIMKTAVRRLRKLEIRFGVANEAMRKVVVPSPAEMIIERLAAGEWQCALKLLELPEQDVWQEWQSSVHRTSPSRMLDIDFMDLSGLRQTLERSLGDLPPELRYDIARRLLDTDTE